MPTEHIDILLVEDNPGDARLLQEAFSTIETEVALEVIGNGDEAVEFLRRRGDSERTSLPDLALLDLNLPGKDGHEVLSTVSADPELERLPVIVLTSSEDDEDVAKCYGANANAYLTKPRTHHGVVKLVKALEKFWFEQSRLPSVPS